LKKLKFPNGESSSLEHKPREFDMRGLEQSKSHAGTSYRERGVSATRYWNYSISDSRQKLHR